MKQIILLLIISATVAQAQFVQPTNGQQSTIKIQPDVGQNNMVRGDDGQPLTVSGTGDAMKQLFPFFDPGTENFQWNGITWNLNNQRAVRARFEKFLNAAEEEEKANTKYALHMRRVETLLLPRSVNGKVLDEAFKHLAEASRYKIDAGLCETIMTSVYSAWASKNNEQRLHMANYAIEERQRKENWNMYMTAKSRSPGESSTSSSKKNTRNDAKSVLMAQHTSKLLEMKTLIESNKLKKEISELNSKLEFQQMMVHFFMQRRFQHVLITTAFYRHIFKAASTQLELEGDARDAFANSTGLPPTVATLDTLAKEAIRDVNEGVETFNYLYEQDELESATKRLAESFWLGEYLPEMRGLPRERKRAALKFTQDYFKLLSALDVKDYTLAEELLGKLDDTATDFDPSKAMAVIETSKVIGSMHLAQARNAAIKGDTETLKAELEKATRIWPRNPELKEVSSLIFKSGDIQQQALLDFDRLMAQKNFRQIFDDQARYIAATSMYPEYQERLKEVLKNMHMIEGSIIRSQEMAKRGMYAGAWEAVEKAYLDFQEDVQLNQERANLTTKASGFVRALRKAEDLEQREQIGSSLAWFLKAQSMHPTSEFAQDGIRRLSNRILPDGVESATVESTEEFISRD